MAQDSFYTLTPGSAVADELQNILARKRAESQQNLVNQISMKKMQDEDEYRTENIASLREQREANAALKAAQEAKIRQEREDKVTRLKGLQEFRNTPGYANLPPDARASYDIAINTGNDQLLNTIINNYMKPTEAEKMGRLITYDEAANKYLDAAGNAYTGQVGPHDKITTRNRPPRDLRDSIQWLGPATDPNTNQPIPGKSFVIQNGKFAVIDNPTGANIGAKPTAAGAGKGGLKAPISDIEMRQWSNAFGNTTQPGTKGQKALATFNALDESLRSRFSQFPDIAGVGDEILQAEDPNTPVDQIIQNALANGSIEPQEAPILAQYLVIRRRSPQ